MDPEVNSVKVTDVGSEVKVDSVCNSLVIAKSLVQTNKTKTFADAFCNVHLCDVACLLCHPPTASKTEGLGCAENVRWRCAVATNLHLLANAVVLRLWAFS